VIVAGSSLRWISWILVFENSVMWAATIPPSKESVFNVFRIARFKLNKKCKTDAIASKSAKESVTKEDNDIANK
jgi:hypothetical protein